MFFSISKNISRIEIKIYSKKIGMTIYLSGKKQKICNGLNLFE